MIAKELIFNSRQELAEALAGDVEAELNRALAARGEALLAVSGGSTPALFFERLSHAPIDWSSVRVTLVDERQVPLSSERSNARLVHEHLLRNRAAKATFIPLFDNPDAARLPGFDVVILGMGTDGHTASFFPGGDRLREAIDPASHERLIGITAPGAGEPRLTFTLPALIGARAIMLHIEGAQKQEVLRRALEGGPETEMPVRAVLRSKAPITLYWCP
jgi:6-phosphogluconolactonase